MKNAFIGLLALASVSVFAQSASYNTCKLYVFDDYLNDSAAMEILISKGYEIVKSKDLSDFSFENIQTGESFNMVESEQVDEQVDDQIVPAAPVISVELVHHATQLRLGFMGEAKSESTVVHSENEQILYELQSIHTVNERARLQKKLKPELDTRTPAQSQYVELSNQLPTCSEILGPIN